MIIWKRSAWVFYCWVVASSLKYEHSSMNPALGKSSLATYLSRIQSKILLLTWKSLNGLAPSYVSQLLTPYVPTQTLRLSDKLLLSIPKTSSYGYKAFSSYAPKQWNSLPMDIRSCVTIVVVLLSLHLKIAFKRICSNLHIMFNCIYFWFILGIIHFLFDFAHCLISGIVTCLLIFIVGFCIFMYSALEYAA